MVNSTQKKQQLFRAKALALKLKALQKKLQDPYLKQNDVKQVKAEIEAIQKRFKELGLSTEE